MIDYDPAPVILPLTADLAAPGQFLTSTQAGALAAAGTDNYSFSFQPDGAPVDQQRQHLPRRAGSGRRGQRPAAGGAARSPV